jgi:hypothetical protein
MPYVVSYLYESIRFRFVPHREHIVSQLLLILTCIKSNFTNVIKICRECKIGFMIRHGYQEGSVSKWVGCNFL